ncbi:15374_t:CDS:2 [Acaulospora morrowiae]|uniref:15374_t:CDS:1 n=1 Tax=Acaulospora morrowiae TaxID=94023 RepID=A0A9N9DW70_9GLOM|nr:15374_t:CDS:2 [Acaulospora morrowiae]
MQEENLLNNQLNLLSFQDNTTDLKEKKSLKYYCYRHRPDLQKARKGQEPTMEELYKQAERLPEEQKEAIKHIWSYFSAASSSNRNLILQGILNQCCLPQLSFLSHNLRGLIRIDFISTLPIELAFHVLSYLDAISLCRAAQVSKLWRKLADNDFIWHQLCAQHINKKCVKCGWGLPSLFERGFSRERSFAPLSCYTPDRPRSLPSSPPSSPSTTSPSTPNASGYDSQDEFREPVRTRASYNRSTTFLPDMLSSQIVPENHQTQSWKQVYAERQVVERNWRKCRCRTRVLKGHSDGVMCLQYDDCNNILITGSYDTTVRVWNIDSGEVIRVFTGHTRCVRALQFDGKKLITCSMDHTLRVWNFHTGKCLRVLEGHTDGVLSLHFDDNILVSGSADNNIKVWNIHTCECFTLVGHQEWVNRVVIYKKTKLFSCSDDHTIRVWDLKSRVCTRVIEGHNAPIQCIQPAYSLMASINKKDLDKIQDPMKEDPEPHPVIISGALDNIIKIWSIQTGECLRTLFGHEDGVWSLAVDKLRLVSVSQDHTVKIWDKDSADGCLHTLHGHCGAVNCVALGETKIITGGEDAEIRIWDFKA